jgi:hypothetical protein
MGEAWESIGLWVRERSRKRHGRQFGRSTREQFWKFFQELVKEFLKRIRICSKRFIGWFRKRKLDCRPTSWRNYDR